MPPNNENPTATTTSSSFGAIPERELQTYCRLIRWVFLLLIFWIIILWLTEHHDDRLALCLLGFLLLWLLYMLFYICCMLCSVRALAARSSQPRDGLLLRDNDDDDDDDIRDDDEDQLLKYDFDDTPTKIRDCDQLITPNMAPKNGIYTVVYSAIYFGKAMRSEAKITLDFQETKTGWEITGKADFKTKAAIEKGFINPKGEMYWETHDCMYRGVLDFESSTMFDGEFLSSTGSRGRVVRLELTPSPSTDIEMSSITGSKSKTPHVSVGTLV
jgi:hypothetical protein